jgi:hypothetical protein
MAEAGRLWLPDAAVDPVFSREDVIGEVRRFTGDED